MNFYQAIVLGIVQGLGEFLPISSTAHLIAVPYLFGWQDPGLDFDVALHWGTLLAVVVFFWRDYWHYIKAFFRTFTASGTWQDPDQRLAWYLILATIPAGVFGFLLESKADSTLRAPMIMVVTMAV